MIVEFSLKLVHIQPCVGKIFKFTVFEFLENALNLAIFTHVLEKNSYLDEGWLFKGGIKVGSVPDSEV